MQTTLQEQYTTQENVNQTNTDNRKSPLIEHEPISNTPFVITGNEEKGYFLRFGDYRLTEFEKTKEDVIQTMWNNQWEIISKLIITIIEIHEDRKHNNYSQTK